MFDKIIFSNSNLLVEKLLFEIPKYGKTHFIRLNESEIQKGNCLTATLKVF